MKHMMGIFLSLLLYSGASAQPDTLWTRVYGGEDEEWCGGLQITSDGGFIIIGSTNSFGPPGEHAWLIKTDSAGDTLWTRIYPMTGGSCVQQTLDGGYIVCGTDYSVSYAAYLIKTDDNGDTTWTRSYADIIPPEFDFSWANAVRQTDDGGYIFAGKISSQPVSDEIYLVRTDPQGDTLWTRIFGGAGYDVLYDLVETDDGSYVSVGITASYGNGQSDVYIIKTDPDGNTVWTRTYGWVGHDQGYSIQQTADGGFIVAGYSDPAVGENPDAYLIRTDAQGDTLWTRRIGGIGSDAAYGIVQTQDGGFVAVGGIDAYPYAGGDLWVIRTDSEGDTLWTKRLGSPSFGERGYSIHQTADGGYIMAGITNGTEDNLYDLWLIRLEADQAPVEPAQTSTPTHFELYPAFPNPFNPVTKLKFSLPGAAVISLSIFDTTGRLVGLLADGFHNAGIHEVAFDGTGLPSGLYLCRLQTSFGGSMVKILLMK